MTSILKTDEIQSQNGGAVVKMQTLKHPSASGNNLVLGSDGTTTVSGALTASGGIKVADGGTIGSASDTDAITIDSSGNVLVGKTSADTYNSTNGIELQSSGLLTATRAGTAQILNREDSDGDIAVFRKDGSTVGSIGSTNAIGIRNTYISGTLTGLSFANSAIFPTNQSGAVADNSKDLGYSSGRFDDIYATNSTINTSDRNEKQDIDVLSDAEHNVAVAAKGLIRKFRWKSAVAEKGEDARIHFGIIAQDLKSAFEAEGLDAGRYGMFIHSTWWESEETYTDDDGVEKTRTNIYDTEEEAPESAVKKDRMGVRYSELLAFIISAI